MQPITYLRHLEILWPFLTTSLSLGLDSQAGQISTVSPTARYRCDDSSEMCCQALSRKDGPRHSLHALAYYRENNEVFFCITVFKMMSNILIGWTKNDIINKSNVINVKITKYAKNKSCTYILEAVINN